MCVCGCAKTFISRGEARWWWRGRQGGRGMPKLYMTSGMRTSGEVWEQVRNRKAVDNWARKRELTEAMRGGGKGRKPKMRTLDYGTNKR